jgi:hypothetical protein
VRLERKKSAVLQQQLKPGGHEVTGIALILSINISAILMSSSDSCEMQALKREMRYVTPSVFNYSFAVNNYRALYYVISNKKYRQMQFVVAGSLQDVFF